jgi:hypothetical protein
MPSPAKPKAGAPVRRAKITAAKRPAPKPPVAKPVTPSQGPKKATAQAVNEPSLRFYHSRELREKTDAILTALDKYPDHKGHGEVVADLVVELTTAGMDYYFLRALKMAKVGFVMEQSARIGVSGAVQLIGSVSRKFIVRMDHAQLMAVARHMRELAR